jgi:hypothetical protein
MNRIGFDNEKYLLTQSEKIRERIAQFGGKLYLEFGGKLFDDFHAARVLPGFAPDSKIRMLLQLKDQAEIVMTINASDIEKNKVRGDSGITYDLETLRLIDAFRGFGLYVGSIVLTRYQSQPSAVAFEKKLTDLGLRVYRHYDIPGYPVNGTAAVIQWDEAWTSFESTEEAALEQPAWAGSLLKLHYNIDVSDNSKPDVVLVEYIGREHPIGYYGTQIGHTSNWNTDIPKTDKETLYALRRLQRWMGDVYVREPSGSGYWANIVVSFSQKHKDLVIPVTLSITRVEGGV